MANVSGFYQDIFGIYEGNNINMKKASLRNGEDFHDDNNEVSLPSILQEQGERIIEKPYTYFVLAFHRYDFDFIDKDNREISLWLNGTKKVVERIEVEDDDSQLYYDEAGQGAFQGYDGIFVIKIPSYQIPYPLQNFSVRLENNNGDNVQTCYYSLENNTAWDRLYMDNFKIIGNNSFKFGQLNRRQRTYNNKLFGGYKNYIAKNDVSETETQITEKNIHFFSGDDIYIRGPRVNLFGELMTPGSVCLNNDFSKNYNVSNAFSGDEMYCVRISNSELPSEITSVHVNFQKGGETFRLEAPNAIKGENGKIVSVKDYRANIDLKSPFIYRKIIIREEEHFQLQTTITAEIELNRNLPFNIADAQLTFGNKNGKPVIHNISDWKHFFDFSITSTFNRDTKNKGFSLPNIIDDNGTAGYGKFYLHATNLFDSKKDYYPISDTYIHENKICDDIMYISKHRITPTNNDSITIPGFVVLQGEKFIIYDTVQFDLINLTSTEFSGDLFTFTYEDLTNDNITTFYDFQEKKQIFGCYPYIIQTGRIENPTLKNYSTEEPKRILEAKQNNLFFSFEDNGSDETKEKAGNDFVINRTTNNIPFSFSREGTTTKTINSKEQIVTYEKLEVTVMDLKKENSITFTYYPTYGIGSPQIDTTNKIIAVPVLDVINLLQEDQTNIFDLSPFKNILPRQGGEAIISLHLYYEKGTYVKDLFKLNDIHFTMRGSGSPLGLRSNGVVINPIETDPEDVESGYAEKINVLFNNNKATPIQASVRDSGNNILKQCEIQYKEGKWYFNDVDVSNSNNNKCICLSDLTVNTDNWRQYVIYDDNNDGQYGDSETTVKAKIANLINTIGDNDSGLTKKINDNTTNISNLSTTINGISSFTLSGWVGESSLVTNSSDAKQFKSEGGWRKVVTFSNANIKSTSICIPRLEIQVDSGDNTKNDYGMHMSAFVDSVSVASGSCTIGLGTGAYKSFSGGTEYKWKIKATLNVINV